jgi:hypothetical protein
MSETCTVRIPADKDEAFAPGAWDGSIGKAMAVTLTGRGADAVEGVIRAAEVTDDGSAVLLTVEVPDGTLPEQPLTGGYSIAR